MNVTIPSADTRIARMFSLCLRRRTNSYKNNISKLGTGIYTGLLIRITWGLIAVNKLLILVWSRFPVITKSSWAKYSQAFTSVKGLQGGFVTLGRPYTDIS